MNWISDVNWRGGGEDFFLTHSSSHINRYGMLSQSAYSILDVGWTLSAQIQYVRYDIIDLNHTNQFRKE